MKYEAKKLPKSQIEIIVEVPYEEVKEYLTAAAEKISRNAKIEGFRPGKAPYEIIKQKFGEMAILQEASEDIVIKTYHEAVVGEKLATIGQPKIEIDKMAPGNDFSYKATVAILPEIKIGDYSNLKLQRTPAAIADGEIEKIIEDIKKMRASQTLVDREAKSGDRLEINFDIFLDKVPVENGKQQKYPITIGEGRFIPGFEEKLIGMKAGEVKEFELRFPEDYYEKNLAGKMAEFRVTCTAVYEIALPAVDDEFSQQISGGKFASSQEMRDNIRKNLEEEKKAKIEGELENQLLEKLVGLSEFGELPDILVENEAHRMVHELEEEITHQGLKFEDYLKSIKKTHDELEHDFIPRAELRVKTSILSREVFQEQKMSVSEEEINQEVEHIISHYPDNDDVKKQIDSPYYREYLGNKLGNQKVMEFLKSKIVK